MVNVATQCLWTNRS